MESGRSRGGDRGDGDQVNLREAARIMVERVDEFHHADKAFSPLEKFSQTEYDARRDAFIRTKGALIPASRNLADALKGAAAADGVRIAAEAGSPMARMLEPNGRG